MSLAPTATARVSNPFRSIRPQTGDRRDRPGALDREGAVVPARVARAARDRIDKPNRGVVDASRGARAVDLTREHLLERPEGGREPGEREAGAREAVEGDVRAPAGGGERRDPARHLL